MFRTVFITGANRGIGLEFVKQLLQTGWRVLASCRHPEKADDLQSIAKNNSALTIYALDVTDLDQIKNCKMALGESTIDVLINNAGVMGQPNVTFGKIDVTNMLNVIRTNAIGPIKLFEALHDNIKKSREKCVINISSSMGSIAENTSGKSYAYRTSKTALNMLMRSAAMDLASENIQVLQFHPGWVKTDMGGDQAQISVEESVSGMCKMIENHNDYKSGELYDYTGRARSW